MNRIFSPSRINDVTCISMCDQSDEHETIRVRGKKTSKVFYFISQISFNQKVELDATISISAVVIHILMVSEN